MFALAGNRKTNKKRERREEYVTSQAKKKRY